MGAWALGCCVCVHLVCVRNTARAVVVGRQKRRGCCIPRYLYGRPGSYLKLRRLTQRRCGGDVDRWREENRRGKKPQGSRDGYNMDLHTLGSCKLLAHGTAVILYYIRRPGERRTRTTKRRRWNQRVWRDVWTGGNSNIISRSRYYIIIIIIIFIAMEYTQSLAVSCD